MGTTLLGERMSNAVSFFKARARAIIITVVLVLAVYGLVSYNRSAQAKLEAALASPQQDVRDRAVQGLVQRGHLTDVLANTQNPDEDKDSPQNQASLDLRKNAAASVNRLTAAGKLTPAQSFDTLFSLCKDGGVKDTAETGLTALGKSNDGNLKQVVDRLSNGDPDLRGAAVDVLGKIGGPPAANAVNAVLLLPAAQDAAVSALQKIGPDSVPLVVAHLEDPQAGADIAFRQQMVGLLDQIAAPPSLPELTKLAGRADQASVQRLAQVALADTVLAAYNGAQSARDAVTKAQADLGKAKDAKARADAQKALGDAQAAQAKARSALPSVAGAESTLTGVLQDVNADSEARAQAALAVGRFASAPSVAVLVAALGDFDARVRDAALAGVQSAGAPAVGPLVAALGRKDTAARAAQALGGIGTPQAVSALAAALADPATPDDVREGAATGLGRSGSPAVIPILVGALGDKDGAVVSAAQDGLLTPVLSRPAIPALVAAFARPTPVPFNASQTLARMGALAQSDVAPALAQAGAGGGAATQTWVAVTLGQIGQKNAPALALLRRLAQSPDPHVQYAASQSLTNLTGV